VPCSLVRPRVSIYLLVRDVPVHGYLSKVNRLRDGRPWFDFRERQGFLFLSLGVK
jgi:hypothetical protein